MIRLKNIAKWALLTGVLLMGPKALAIVTPVSLVDAGDADPGDAGDATVTAWLRFEIADYNADHGTTLPDPGAGSLAYKATQNGSGNVGGPPPDPSEYPSFGANVTATTLPIDDYDYLVLHWGGGGPQDTGVTWQAFYIGGTTPAGNEDTFEFDSPSFNRAGVPHGLSSYSYFGPGGTPRVPGTPTPDGGSSILLLGLGLTGISAMARWMQKA